MKWPTDAWSQKAADLSLDILNTKEEWLALSDLAHRFLQNKKLTPAGSKFEKEVAQIGEGAKFEYVMQVYEEKKDYALAAREFKEFVAQYPRSEHAPKALYNVLVIADKAERLDVEIAAGEQLMHDYPKADQQIVKLTIPALASACERTSRYQDAVHWFEEAQARWPQEEKAPDWLFNAALYREGMADDAGALGDWRKYLKQYSNRADAAKIAFNIGLILERQKQWKEVADYWYSFPRSDSRAATPGQLLLARYKQALAMRELKANESNVLVVMGEVAQRFAHLPEAEKASPPVIDAAAHARFMGVEAAFNDFMAIHFRYTRQADLVYVLRIKNVRMNKLVAAYGEVIAIGSPKWSEAAFERIGEAYRNFNKGLLDAPTPRGLDAEQQELYRSTLESQALPLEDKATESFGKSIEVSQKSGVYSDWVLKAQDYLREYQPDSYGEVHRPALLDSELSRSIAPGAALNLARLLHDKPGEAEQVLRKTIAKRDPPEPELLDALAAVLRAQGKLDEARALVRQVLERDPRDADAYRSLAAIEADGGHVRLAESALNNARKLDDKDAGIVNSLGLLAMRRDEAAAARAWFDQATQLDANFAPGWANLGALALSYRDYAAAELVYAKAVQLDPARWNTHLALGWALEGLRRPKDARAEYEKVLALRPGQEDALYGRALALKAEGDLPAALQAFKEYAANSKATHVKEAQGQIASIDMRLKHPPATLPRAAAAQKTAAPGLDLSKLPQGTDPGPSNEKLPADEGMGPGAPAEPAKGTAAVR